eukprot:1281005-Amphidinium_carterae.1
MNYREKRPRNQQKQSKNQQANQPQQHTQNMTTNHEPKYMTPNHDQDQRHDPTNQRRYVTNQTRVGD